MDPLSLALGVVVGALLGAAAVLLLRRSSGNDAAVLAERHQAELANLRADAAAEQAGLRERVAGLEARAAALTNEIENHEDRYRALLARHADEAESRRRADAERASVLQALAPVQETLRTVQGRVAEMEQQRAAQYAALTEQLVETRGSSERARGAAESLASALRNNSVRGAWGEAQLKRLVESAGLLEAVDFDLQATSRSSDGARRPDLVVRLPEGRAIAVDAKVPLAKFIEASEIPESATGAEADRRTTLLREHSRALRAHIDALGAKGYWTDLDSPEFVVAFLPSESLLSAALGTDPSLLDYAFGKKVLLASPVNLWAVLKAVSATWNQQRLADDAKRLFDLGETLYGRLSTLAERAEKLRGAIERTVTAYNEFAGTLETRVLVTARQISRMDATKLIAEPPMIEQAPRPLTAPELQSSP